MPTQRPVARAEARGHLGEDVGGQLAQQVPAFSIASSEPASCEKKRSARRVLALLDERRRERRAVAVARLDLLARTSFSYMLDRRAEERLDAPGVHRERRRSSPDDPQAASATASSAMSARASATVRAARMAVIGARPPRVATCEAALQRRILGQPNPICDDHPPPRSSPSLPASRWPRASLLVAARAGLRRVGVARLGARAGRPRPRHVERAVVEAAAGRWSRRRCRSPATRRRSCGSCSCARRGCCRSCSPPSSPTALTRRRSTAGCASPRRRSPRWRSLLLADDVTTWARQAAGGMSEPLLVALVLGAVARGARRPRRGSALALARARRARAPRGVAAAGRLRGCGRGAPSRRCAAARRRARRRRAGAVARARPARRRRRRAPAARAARDAATPRSRRCGGPPRCRSRSAWPLALLAVARARGARRRRACSPPARSAWIALVAAMPLPASRACRASWRRRPRSSACSAASASRALLAGRARPRRRPPLRSPRRSRRARRHGRRAARPRRRAAARVAQRRRGSRDSHDRLRALVRATVGRERAAALRPAGDERRARAHGAGLGARRAAVARS